VRPSAVREGAGSACRRSSTSRRWSATRPRSVTIASSWRSSTSGSAARCATAGLLQRQEPIDVHRAVAFALGELGAELR